MRLPCRHFKCECVCFICLAEREGVCCSAPASACLGVCFIFMPLHLQPLSGVELLNPFTSPLDLFFTSSAALVRLLAFSL